jgi:Putative zinc- or iron-chelating domain
LAYRRYPIETIEIDITARNDNFRVFESFNHQVLQCAGKLKMPEEKRHFCQDCGLCCDGTMYHSVLLQEEDNKAKLTGHGIPLLQISQSSGFEQPCPASHACSCTIYQDRPTVCREYRCALLKSVDDGHISADTARQLIADTIILRDRLAIEVRGFTGIDSKISLPKLFDEMVAILNEMEPKARQKVNPKLLLDVGTLRIVLSKRFDPKGPLLSKESNHSQSNASVGREGV